MSERVPVETVQPGDLVHLPRGDLVHVEHVDQYHAPAIGDQPDHTEYVIRWWRPQRRHADGRDIPDGRYQGNLAALPHGALVQITRDPDPEPAPRP